MLKPWQKLCLLFLLIGFAIWIRWWASTGFPLDGQICEPPDAAKNCESYNVFFYSTWKLALVANYWSALISAIATVFVAWFTWTLYKSSEKMWSVTAIAANAAQDSANIAKTAMVAGNRAWLRVKANVGGPLVFSEIGASVPIGFEITNIGNSPANNITINVWLMALTSSGPSAWQEQERKCAVVRTHRGGFTLFPGEQFPIEKGIDGFTHGINVSTEDIQNALPASATGKFIMLYVYGCIDYTFPADPDGHHQTGFVYELRKTPLLGLIGPEDGTVAQSNLMLTDAALSRGQQAD